MGPLLFIFVNDLNINDITEVISVIFKIELVADDSNLHRASNYSSDKLLI